MKLETSSTSTEIHHKFGFGTKTKIKIKPVLCVGGGFGAMLLNCNELAKTKTKVGLIGMEQKTGGIVHLSNKEKSNEFTATWSYETSTGM